MAASMIRLVATLTVVALVTSGCSSQSPTVRIAEDCTVGDFSSAGASTRSDCAYVGIDVTLLGSSGEVYVRAEQIYHAEAYFTATGLIPDSYESVEEAVDAFAQLIVPEGSESQIEQELRRPLTNLDGSSSGVVGDYVSKDDLTFTNELNNHQLTVVTGYLDSVTTFGFTVTDTGIVFDTVEEMPSAGHLSMTFPGPVGDTNGTVTGNQVRWEWDSAGEVTFYVEYAAPGFEFGQPDGIVGEIYDFDARTDVATLGAEINVWFAGNDEPPVVEQIGNEYYLGREGALEFISYASDGVSIDYDATYIESVTSWCITVVHPLGMYAAQGISYSSAEGIQDYPCPTP